MSDDFSADSFAEVQGLYGPFTFPELLLQKIWWRREFDLESARTLDGRVVKIVHPGRWNRLGGPDFRGARLRVGDQEVEGDVELHLRARDWEAHGHADDAEYDNVKLHVVLFPSATPVTRGARGREIPVLVLLPLLYHGLEEYAAEDAMEALANRPLDRALETLATLEERELAAVLHRRMATRWEMKVHFARTRVERLGWAGACHHSALEILGYRFNRAPMLGVATRWPLDAWVREGDSLAVQALDAFAGQWKLQGVRPLNHPRLRLRQYAEWVRQRRTWPEELSKLGADLVDVASSNLDPAATTAQVRKTLHFVKLRERVAEWVCGDAVGGTRLDNLICDGFLPLLASANPGDSAHLRRLWAHWYAGDLPESLVRGLRALGVFAGSKKPIAHGPLQGLIGWMLSRGD